MLTRLNARRLLTAQGQIEDPVILIEDGRIVSIEAGHPGSSNDILTPAFFDVHVHGAISHDFMSAGPAEILAVSRFFARQGLAFYLPTTVTGPVDQTLRALETLADAIEIARGHGRPMDAASPVGIHLEGPFVSHAKRGVHPVASLREPSIELFNRFQQAARGHIRLMTLAPELPCALELIAHAASAGVRISLGHSNATQAETRVAIASGASSATHAFNAMRALDHREPGILGTILDDRGVYAEAICDGIHVDPAMIRLWLKIKGEDRAILVTDGMSATGMPDGEYMLGDFSVEVRDGVCLSHGTLAGSVLTMPEAVRNVQQFTGTSLAAAVRMASSNPARMLGLEDQMSLAPGSPANFNLYTEEGHLRGTMLNGSLLPR